MPDPASRKMHVNKFSDNTNVEAYHLAEIPHLAGDLLNEVTETAVAYPGMSSLSLFLPQRKIAPKLPNRT